MAQSDYRCAPLKSWDADFVAQILDALHEFVCESSYGWTPERNHSNSELWAYYQLDECDVLVVDQDGDVAGVALVSCDRAHHVETIGYLSKFYVRKHYRATGAARALRDGVSKWFKDKGCTDSFITNTAGIGEDKYFMNLFNKDGYEICGHVLRRHHG